MPRLCKSSVKILGKKCVENHFLSTFTQLKIFYKSSKASYPNLIHTITQYQSTNTKNQLTDNKVSLYTLSTGPTITTTIIYKGTKKK